MTTRSGSKSSTRSGLGAKLPAVPLESDVAAELVGSARALLAGQRFIIDLLGQMAEGDQPSLLLPPMESNPVNMDSGDTTPTLRPSSQSRHSVLDMLNSFRSEQANDAQVLLRGANGCYTSSGGGGTQSFAIGPPVQSCKSSMNSASIIKIREELESNIDNLQAVYADHRSTLLHLVDDECQSMQSVESTSSFHHRASRHSIQSRLMFSPTSPVRLVMDLVSLVVLAYDLLSLPYLITFEVPQEGLVLNLTYVSLCFWICDMLLSFRTGYYKGGSLVMGPYEVARHYVSRHFLLDLILILMDLASVVLYHWEEGKSGAPDAFKMGRVVKMTRIMRCMNIMRVRSIKDVMSRLSMGKTFLHASTVVMLDTVKFASIILWLNHTIACGWYAIGKWITSDTGISWLDQPTGDHRGRVYRETGDMYIYTTSLHWAITQMTPGSMQVFPQNSAERIYNSTALIFGMIVFSTLISSISSTVAHFKMKMNDENRKTDTLRQFLVSQRFSPELCMAIQKQVMEKLKHRKPLIVKDVEVLDVLSLSLRSKLQTELCRPHLLPHTFFHMLFEMDASLAQETFLTCTDFHVLAKGDTLFLRGTEAASLKVVVEGSLAYSFEDRLGEDNQRRDVPHGKWVAEAALWCHWRHVGTAEVETVAACEVMDVLSTKLAKLLKRCGGVCHALSWAYAQSFGCQLAASRRANDLELFFDAGDVMSAMPREAKAACGLVALQVLRKEVSNRNSRVTKDQFKELSRAVDEGHSALVLTGSKQRVQWLSSSVQLRLCRQDGKMLAHLVLLEEKGHTKVACQLPDAELQQWEHPKKAMDRFVQENFREMACSVLQFKTVAQDETNDSGPGGVATKRRRYVTWADWLDEAAEPWSPVGEARLVLRQGRRPSISGGLPISPHCQQQETEVFELPSGNLAAWIDESMRDSIGPLQWLPGRSPKTSGSPGQDSALSSAASSPRCQPTLLVSQRDLLDASL